MASVSRDHTAAGLRWRVRYRTPDHRQTDKRGFKTKRDAEAFAATVEVKKLTGQFIAESAGKVTIGELAIPYLDRKKHSTAASTFRMTESAWRVHVAPKWSAQRVNEITALDVETWVAQMVKNGAGPTTVIRAHGVLSGVLTDAVRSRRLALNPAKGITNLPRKRARRRVYLSAHDLHHLADESGEHRALVLVLGFCGLRWGEAIALRVRDVHFLRRRLHVSENAVQLGVDHAVGETKGREARSVPVPAFVLDELAQTCDNRAGEDLIFPATNGGYLPRPKSSGGWFVQAVKRSGVQRVTPHDLRHTAASLAVSAGANVLALARMLGHRDPSVTLRVYADLFDTDLDAVAASLHSEFSRDGVGTKWANARGK